MDGLGLLEGPQKANTLTSAFQPLAVSIKETLVLKRSGSVMHWYFALNLNNFYFF